MNDYKQHETTKTKKGQKQSRGKSSKNFGSRSADTARNVYNSNSDRNKYTGSNDVSWYSKNPQILSSAGNLSYNTALGSRLFLTQSNGQEYQGDKATAIPGIMHFNFIAGPGRSLDEASPVNIAAQNIYSYIRNTNSGAKNYDAPDIMMYLLALDQVYLMWNYFKRVYGVANVYDQRNRYLPEALINSMGLELDDVIDNLANIRTKLNVLAAKIASFAVPSNMPYFIRHSWLTSNIYRDADVDKSQLYVFSPGGFYTFSETASQKGGSLIYTTLKETTSILDEMALLETAVNRLLYSYDVGTISGDIIKAYGSSGLFTITPVDENYRVYPVFNPEVLTQIHNMTITPVMLDGLAIKQDPNTNNIIYDPKPQDDAEKWYYKRIINLPFEYPTPADTMVASRLITGVSANGLNFTTFASEIIQTATICQFTFDSNGVRSFREYNFRTQAYSSPVTMDNIILKTNFDWAPMTYVLDLDDDAETFLRNIAGDIQNYAVLETQFLSDLNETALLSLFNVPQIGQF